MSTAALIFGAMMIMLCLVMVPLVLYQAVRESARLKNNLTQLARHDRALEALTRKYQSESPHRGQASEPDESPL
jgi:uncharacterized membrane protein